MVVFMVAAMIIAAAAAAPNILTQGRREKETEMVWRGQQYVRAIGLYYRKFGKYPTKVEDLTKQTNGVRFLRQAYTDPMNKDDGSWRFIYVGPNGQLIGSLRQTSLLQTALTTPGMGALSALGWRAATAFAAGATTGANQAPGIGQARAANEPCRGSKYIAIPTAAAYRTCVGRKHYRRGEQDETAFLADLFGRRHLPGVGIHLEPHGADCSAITSAGQPERESHSRSERHQSQRTHSERTKSERNESEPGKSEWPRGATAAAEPATADRECTASGPVEQASACLD